MTNQVTTTWLGGTTFESTNPSGHTIKIDTSPEHGGGEEGLRPKALMLTALAGCSGLDVASLMKKMKSRKLIWGLVWPRVLVNPHDFCSGIGGHLFGGLFGGPVSNEGPGWITWVIARPAIFATSKSLQ